VARHWREKASRKSDRYLRWPNPHFTKSSNFGNEEKVRVGDEPWGFSLDIVNEASKEFPSSLESIVVIVFVIRAVTGTGVLEDMETI